MNKRKTEVEEIPKREPKKKTAGANFSNIRLELHPAAVLFGLNSPLAAQENENLDAQGISQQDAPIQAHLDAQAATMPDARPSESLGTLPHQTQDAQLVTTDARTPENFSQMDAQPPKAKELGAQITEKLDAQKSTDRNDGRTRHHLRLRNAVSKTFTEFCTLRKMPLQDFLELAGVHFLECVAAQSLLNLDAQAPIDDLKIFKTREDIIRAYQELTGNRWKASDDEAGVLFARADIRCVEIGMLNTYLNFKGKRINSFKYFRAEIEDMVDTARETNMQDQTIEILLRRRRQQWEKKKAQAEAE